MYGAHVSVQIAWCRTLKPTIIHGTFERSLVVTPGVASSNMSGQIDGCHARNSTVRLCTLERSPISVLRSHVGGQCTRFSSRILTLSTLEGLLPGVGSHVQSQCTRLSSHIITLEILVTKVFYSLCLSYIYTF